MKRTFLIKRIDGAFYSGYNRYGGYLTASHYASYELCEAIIEKLIAGDMTLKLQIEKCYSHKSTKE